MTENEKNNSYQFGEIIFAKIKGWPFWPATIGGWMDQKNKYLVNFIGESSHAYLTTKEILPFMPNYKEFVKTKRKDAKRMAHKRVAKEKLREKIKSEIKEAKREEKKGGKYSFIDETLLVPRKRRGADNSENLCTPEKVPQVRRRLHKNAIKVHYHRSQNGETSFECDYRKIRDEISKGEVTGPEMIEKWKWCHTEYISDKNTWWEPFLKGKLNELKQLLSAGEEVVLAKMRYIELFIEKLNDVQIPIHILKETDIGKSLTDFAMKYVIDSKFAKLRHVCASLYLKWSSLISNNPETREETKNIVEDSQIGQEYPKRDNRPINKEIQILDQREGIICPPSSTSIDQTPLSDTERAEIREIAQIPQIASTPSISTAVTSPIEEVEEEGKVMDDIEQPPITNIPALTKNRYLLRYQHQQEDLGVKCVTKRISPKVLIHNHENINLPKKPNNLNNLRLINTDINVPEPKFPVLMTKVRKKLIETLKLWSGCGDKNSERMGREAEEIIRSKDQSMGSNYKAYVSILHEFIKDWANRRMGLGDIVDEETNQIDFHTYLKKFLDRLYSI